ncbi:MAG: hypothetical protein J6S14_17165 [Clostridia bacterium]|nr:hypothetical protein [Clostridia bacterium]
MKLNFISRSARSAALLIVLALMISALASCGVIIINKPETEPPATTVTPETSTSPEQSGVVTESPETTEEPLETEAPDVETEPPKQISFPSRIEEAEERLAALGEPIRITDFHLIYAAADNTVDVIFSDEESPLYAARTKRNSMIEEKYSSVVRTIYEGKVTSDRLYEDVRVAVSSGNITEYYLDLLVLTPADACKFLAKGLLKDMRSLPFYDVNLGPQGGNIGQTRYFDLGAGADAPETLYAMYFNRALVGADNAKMLYEASLDGKMSWELLCTVAASISDRDADMAIKDGENTLPGELAAYLSGIEYVSKSAAGVPKITLSDSAALEIDALIESISKLGFYTPAEGDAYARDKFTAGKVPFYLGTLSEMLDFYDEPIEWGILTLPSDKDFGAFAENRPVLCIPATNTRLEQTSIWLTAFNAASGDWMRDQFLLVSLEKHIRDNNSCLVLNKLLSQKAEFAFERVFAGYYDGLKDATYGAAGKALTGGDKFSAVLAKNITSINKKLAKLP